MLNSVDLQLIIQIHTCGGYLADGNYVYCSSCDVQDHVNSFRNQILSCLEMNPILINCHSGVDSWNNEEALSYFQQVLALESELLTGDYSSIKIVHETHRQRLLFSPFQASYILSHPTMKDLKINADLSHWVCVCERIMSLTDSRDQWWPKLMTLVASHCHFIHARVGYAEGPQVPDPRSEAYQNEVAAHLQWWEIIWNHELSSGSNLFIIEPEHGPMPYQIYSNVCPDRIPASALNKEMADEILWDINNYITLRIKECWQLSK